MGCVESTEALSTGEEEEEGPPEAKRPASATTAAPKGKKKKRLNIKGKQDLGKKTSASPDSEHPKKSDKTKITVIWRRYSAFSSRHESDKSDEEPAGPSKKPPGDTEAGSS